MLQSNVNPSYRIGGKVKDRYYEASAAGINVRVKLKVYPVQINFLLTMIHVIRGSLPLFHRSISNLSRTSKVVRSITLVRVLSYCPFSQNCD